MTTSKPTDPPGPGAPASSAKKRWSYSRSDRSKRNGPLRRSFRVFRRRVLSPMVPIGVPLALRGLGRTWRVSTSNGERRAGVLESSDGCIAVLWHGRMAAAAPIFRGVRATILVSRSGDGDLADVLLGRLGYDTIRGSSGKVGAVALKTLRAALEGGGTIAITPDGPRGPRHHVNRGAAFLARATGRRILPIGFAARRARRLRSWDRFLIPSPFTRVHVTFGEPIAVPSDASDEQVAAISRHVGEQLMLAESNSFAELGEEVDW